MNRRALLKAAPALALAGAVPAQGYMFNIHPSRSSSLSSLWHEAEVIKARLNRPDADLDSPEWEADYDKLIALQDEICSRPATSLADWAAKVLNADDSGMFANCNVWADTLLAEARALIAA